MTAFPTKVQAILHAAADAYSDYARQHIELLTEVDSQPLKGAVRAQRQQKNRAKPSGLILRQNWSRLAPGDPVLVSEYGHAPYKAIVDLLTDDASVIWIVTSTSAERRAFDCREGITIDCQDANK